MRTQAQKDADEFDRELFGLMDDARSRGDKGSAEWRKVSALLSEARIIVRRFMHPDDRKGTEG